MTKLFIEDLQITGKKILMRVDFNVPLDHEGNVADATRIQAALPSINYVLKQNGSLILMSHLGRPQNTVKPELSLAPVAKTLSALLNKPVELAPNCVGDSVKSKVDSLQSGQILLLENLRFHRAEEHPDEDPSFAQKLASYGDSYVNDAFGTAHRKHSSTYTIAQYFPNKAAAGYLLEKEIHFLGDILKKPERPFYALLGGAKVSSKMGVIKSLLKKVDSLLIGGGMAYTFLKAKKVEVGNSLLEEDLVPLAEELLEEYGEKIILPIDFVVATETSETATITVAKTSEGILPGYQGLDIGPATRHLFAEKLGNGKTILWNGPFGVYEIPQFAKGTQEIARTLALLQATTIIGGGDLVAAVAEAHVSEKMTHISTGGGATLEYIEHGTLPGIEVLSEKQSP